MDASQESEPSSLRYEKVYDLPLSEPSTYSPLLRALAFSPDGHHLAGAFDRTVTVWRLSQHDDDGNPSESWKIMVNYRLDERAKEEEFTCLVWARSGVLLVGASTGDVKMVTLNNEGTTVNGFQATKLSIKYLALNSEQSLLAVAAGEDEVVIWAASETGSWSKLHRLPDPGTRLARDEVLEVTFIGWHGTGKDSLVVSYLHHGVLSWNVFLKDAQGLLNPDKVFVRSSPGFMSQAALTTTQSRNQDKLNSLHDPDSGASKPQITHRARPGEFVHQGQFYLGAGVGKINLWHAARNIRAQRLVLSVSQPPSTSLI
ncbi:hypothetical protein MD484_g8417, partial [Candolleomyces efflorescens]